MGRKLDAVKNKSKEGGESFKKSAELGNKAVSDVKQMKKLIDSLPTDVDDEITAAAKAVEQGTKSDAEGYMKGEVEAKLESGRKIMDDSSKEAGDQVKKNEQVQAIFAQMDSVGGFGKGARTEGRSRIESSTKEFNRIATENAEKTRKADEEFKKNLSDISSTF